MKTNDKIRQEAIEEIKKLLSKAKLTHLDMFLRMDEKLQQSELFALEMRRKSGGLDLCQLLKGLPMGIELFSPAFGPVRLDTIDKDFLILKAKKGCERISIITYFDGRIIHCPEGECVVFPSSEHRTWEDWSSYKQYLLAKLKKGPS